MLLRVALFVTLVAAAAGTGTQPPFAAASGAVGSSQLNSARSDSDCWGYPPSGLVYVPETGHNIGEPFLSAWRRYDLSIMGYPISEAIEENGMTVQYFERVRMELHPENAGTPYEVLFTLIGDWLAGAKDNPAFAPQPPDASQADSNARYYAETGHYLQAPFDEFWQSEGGLAVFGYPRSEMFEEGGYLVQYFERARFEYHPEHAGTKYEVELGLIGRDLADAHGIDQSAAPMNPDAVDWRSQPVARSFRIPTLMYHRFSTSPSRFTVTYSNFEQQLIWLRDNGYTPITIDEAYRAMFAGGPLPEKPVVITLDDGWASQWAAADILEQYGYRGTFFVLLDGEMSPDQLRALAARGHEIESHTFSHAYLTRLSDDQLWHEVNDSRAALAQILNQPVNYFAYPSGDWNSRVISAVQAAGYCGAVHAWDGKQWTPEKRWIEPRVEISGTLSISVFAELVTSG